MRTTKEEMNETSALPDPDAAGVGHRRAPGALFAVPLMSHRIVSLIASATEIVCALGFDGELVGRSHECDYPAFVSRLPTCSSSKVEVDAVSRAIDDQVRTIVSEGLSVYRVNPDFLNLLAPTVIITQTQCEVCAVSLRDVEEAVCELVTSQPAIVSLEPMSLGDVWEDIRKVASALGNPGRGDDLVTGLKDRLQGIRTQAEPVRTRPSIACIEWIDPLMSAANWMPELVECAGGRNLFGEPGKHSGYFDFDQLAAPFLDPAAEGGKWAAVNWQNIASDLAAYDRGETDAVLSGFEGLVRAHAEDAEAAGR